LLLLLLPHHACRDVDKLRVKPRNFKFSPVRAWLGGTMTEKVEGWKCAVYEATGKVGAHPGLLLLHHSAAWGRNHPQSCSLERCMCCMICCQMCALM
jgi:hypothetical protein